MLKLTAENDELKSIIEQPELSKAVAASERISESISVMTERNTLIKEKEYYRQHHSTMKLKFDELLVKLVEEETKLRALVLKNQEIVEKWTTRQYNTEDEIITVELVKP